MATKKAAAKKPAVKKPAVKKVVAKKAVAKKPVVKKPVVKKVAAKKPAVKKAVAKKAVVPKLKVSPKEQTIEVARRLAIGYPEVICELDHRNAFELLAATILSAQCTDVRVNMVTPALFARFPDPWSLASADQSEVETLIRSTGFYQSKARNLMGMAQNLVERFGGEVPSELSDLVTLPGVGRKTGNVVRSVVFDLPGLPVDTHVGRLSRRLGLTKHEDPVKVELQLNEYLPGSEWGAFSLRLILHGRRVCDARKPKCTICEMADICPSAGLPVTAPTTKRSPRKK